MTNVPFQVSQPRPPQPEPAARAGLPGPPSRNAAVAKGSRTWQRSRLPTPGPCAASRQTALFRMWLLHLSQEGVSRHSKVSNMGNKRPLALCQSCAEPRLSCPSAERAQESRRWTDGLCESSVQQSSALPWHLPSTLPSPAAHSARAADRASAHTLPGSVFKVMKGTRTRLWDTPRGRRHPLPRTRGQHPRQLRGWQQ